LKEDLKKSDLYSCFLFYSIIFRGVRKYMLEEKVIVSLEDKCEGCNKCIRSCPQFLANKAIKKNGQLKIFVNQKDCVACGECIKSCSHDARVFLDDTDKFMNALHKGEDVAIIVAPAFLINYPDEKKRI
jgi:NAD-dependent dihydropyrimidine dehydrogenase PreA subunit